MNRTVRVILSLVLIAAWAHLAAWQNVKSKPAPKGGEGESKHFLIPTVYLGRSDYHGGPIKKSEFERLMKQGLTSRDSLGNKYKVQSFDFNYAERQFGEDSIGNPKVYVEVLYEFCPGDTISANVAASIYERTKPGDTVFIDNVRVTHISKNKAAAAIGAIGAKGLKCVITK